MNEDRKVAYFRQVRKKAHGRYAILVLPLLMYAVSSERVQSCGGILGSLIFAL